MNNVKYKNILPNIMSNYENKMTEWNKHYFFDNTIEEIVYTKEKLKIVFQEDLREHIVNFSVLHPEYRLIKVYFRTTSYNANKVEINELLREISKLGNCGNQETQEVKIYFDFLYKNKIIQ